MFLRIKSELGMWWTLTKAPEEQTGPPHTEPSAAQRLEVCLPVIMNGLVAYWLVLRGLAVGVKLTEPKS